MTTQQNLLKYGYFPKEIAPPFHTELYAAANSAGVLGIAAPVTCAEIVEHGLSRPSNVHRLLGIPNPFFYRELCQEIEANWIPLKTIAYSSPFSISKPIARRRFKSPQQRAVRWGGFARNQEEARAFIRRNARFIVKADISNFYPSIYTHSIPWAIHGKSFAKANRGRTHYGNRLDNQFRNCQHGQTMGVPIGIDTSFVIAEVLLGAVDKNLSMFRGFRYFDDYEFAATSFAEAEEVLGLLMTQLGSLGLKLNENKTGIFNLPDALFGNPWAPELASFIFSDQTNSKSQRNDIIRYFDKSFIIANQFPQKSVLAYSLGRIKIKNIAPSNMALLARLIMQSAMNESGAIMAASKLLREIETAGHTIRRIELQEFINSCISTHAKMNHGNDVAWAIWLAIVHQLPIDQAAAIALSRMEDSVVAILALDAHSLGLIPNGLNTTAWQMYMTQSELYGPNWLLSYEANRKNWLPSNGGIDHVLQDPFFSTLKNTGVSFYDRSRPLNLASATSLADPAVTTTFYS